MIYLVRMQGTNYVKIGIAEKPKKRLSSLASGNPMPLELLFSCSVNQPSHHFHLDETVEQEIHAELEPYRVRGEWFDLTQEQVGSVIAVLTDRFRERPIWNRWHSNFPPSGYIGEYVPKPLLAFANVQST